MTPIEKSARALSDLLGIRTPSVRLVPPSALTTPTQMGALDPNTRSVVIRDTLLIPDRIFALAHELRHLWQYEKGTVALGDLYTDLESSVNLTQYNSQEAELDANAFADFVSRCFLGLKPLFTGVDEKIVSDIRKRSVIIEKQYMNDRK